MSRLAGLDCEPQPSTVSYLTAKFISSTIEEGLHGFREGGHIGCKPNEKLAGEFQEGYINSKRGDRGGTGEQSSGEELLGGG
jgi:hypothetical protein